MGESKTGIAGSTPTLMRKLEILGYELWSRGTDARANSCLAAEKIQTELEAREWIEARPKHASGQQNHPQAILEEALDAGRVPEPLREQYRRRMSAALLREVGEAMELFRPVPHVYAGIEGFEAGGS